MPISDDIQMLIEPVLEDLGFELVDIEYLSGQGRDVLRIYADSPSGINLDDCAMISREVGDLLDVKDVVKHRYVLEVSSPGLDRRLKRAKDFQDVIGKQIKVKTHMALEGRKNFTGVLEAVNNRVLQLRVDDVLVLISLEQVKRANLIYDFGDE